MSRKFPKQNNVILRKKVAYPILLAAALIFITFTYAFYIPAIKSTTIGINSKYPLLNSSVALIEKKDLVVNFQALRESLEQKYETREDYLISLYFEYLPTGANISVNKDAEVWPASLIKIPVAMAAMKKVEDGKWDLSNELVILDEDKDSEFGELYKKPTGTTMTIEETLKQALVNSDNTAHFVLLRNIESNELEDVYTHLGMDDIVTALKKTPKGQEADNRITAKRYTVFFRSLYNSTFLKPENSQKFLDILKGAPKENLDLGLPENVLFVHKTGVRIDEAVRADSGIVYLSGRPYLITVMIQKKDKIPAAQGEVENLFKEISKEIYDYVSKAE